jgi:hypothetical protein
LLFSFAGGVVDWPLFPLLFSFAGGVVDWPLFPLPFSFAGGVVDWPLFPLPFSLDCSGALFPRNGADVFSDDRDKDRASVPDPAVSGKAKEGIVESPIKPIIKPASERTAKRNMKWNPL